MQRGGGRGGGGGGGVRGSAEPPFKLFMFIGLGVFPLLY